MAKYGFQSMEISPESESSQTSLDRIYSAYSKYTRLSLILALAVLIAVPVLYNLLNFGDANQSIFLSTVDDRNTRASIRIISNYFLQEHARLAKLRELIHSTSKRAKDSGALQTAKVRIHHDLSDRHMEVR